MAAIGRRQHLERHHALQHLVERPEDDAEAAPAENLQHLIVSDPAERIGTGGRGEEGEVIVVRIFTVACWAARSPSLGCVRVPGAGGIAGLPRKLPAASWD